MKQENFKLLQKTNSLIIMLYVLMIVVMIPGFIDVYIIFKGGIPANMSTHSMLPLIVGWIGMVHINILEILKSEQG